MTNLHTLSVHSGTFTDEHGAVMPPIYATSTFAQPAPGQHTGYEYSRSGNPTRHALETAIADLESGTRGYAFASGLAAISTVLELLDKDSHLVAVDDVYGGTYRLIENVRRRSAGLRVSWVKPDDLAAIEAAIRPDTRMIWVETPTNPLLKLADLSAIAAIARRHNIISVTDNTFASPAIHRPLELGFDIVVHSATKYLNGHSDVVAGLAVVGDNAALAEKLGYLQNAVGGVLDPFSSSDAARYSYPGAAYGAPQQQCAAARRVAGAAAAGRKGLVPVAGLASASSAGAQADGASRRDDLRGGQRRRRLRRADHS